MCVDVISASSLIGADADVLRERNFQLLLLANLVALLGNPFLSPVLDSLVKPFGIAATKVGLMLSAYTAPGIIVIPVAGRLADQLGRKPVLFTGLIVFGLAGTSIAFTTDFRVVLSLRLLQGVGAAAIVPIIITSIGDMYEGSREATAQGLRLTCSGVTNMIFPLLAGIIVGIAWQFPFLLYAISFLGAATVYLWFTEPKEVVMPEPDVASSGSTDPALLRDLLSYRRVQLMLFVRVLPVVVWIGFLTYNSIIVVRFMGESPTYAGLLVAVASLAHAVAAAQAGRITTLFESRLYPLLAANVALGGGFGLLFLVADLRLAMASMFLSGIGFGVTLSLYRSIITGYAPFSLRGSLVSVSEGMSRLAMTVTPVLMGFAIANITPHIGFRSAVQATGLAVALLTTVGGLLGLLVVNIMPPVPHTKSVSQRMDSMPDSSN